MSSSCGAMFVRRSVVLHHGNALNNETTNFYGGDFADKHRAAGSTNA
jgi:hypothetical protein